MITWSYAIYPIHVYQFQVGRVYSLFTSYLQAQSLMVHPDMKRSESKWIIAYPIPLGRHRLTCSYYYRIREWSYVRPSQDWLRYVPISHKTGAWDYASLLGNKLHGVTTTLWYSGCIVLCKELVSIALWPVTNMFYAWNQETKTETVNGHWQENILNCYFIYSKILFHSLKILLRPLK